MRAQGALTALTEILDETIIHPITQLNTMSRLEIVETLCKLLFKNASNQFEFRKLDGYTLIFNVFDQFIAESFMNNESVLHV